MTTFTRRAALALGTLLLGALPALADNTHIKVGIIGGEDEAV